MGIITGVAESLIGNWVKAAAFPLAFTVAITGWHQFAKARQQATELREAALVKRGRDQCISEVELATSKAETLAAQARARQAEQDASAAALIAQEVQANAQSLKEELEQVKDAKRAADAANPDLCFSPGVRELLRGPKGSAGPR